MTIDLITVLPVLIVGLALLVVYLRASRHFSVARLVMVIAFAIYLTQVSRYTIFPIELGTTYVDTLRSQTRLLDGVNLLPFKGLSIRYLASVQGWGNVALGGPFGFLLPFVVPVLEWRRMVLRGLFFGAAIELLQLLIALLYGFAYRIIDVNDIILNFAGVMTGYALLRGIASLYRAAVLNLGHGPPEGRLRSQNQGLWADIQSVLLTQASPRV
jgi:glycopeptide antibiotics resistance protein